MIRAIEARRIVEKLPAKLGMYNIVMLFKDNTAGSSVIHSFGDLERLLISIDKVLVQHTMEGKKLKLSKVYVFDGNKNLLGVKVYG